uniref:Uncharacterized protein n=1 Tax=viral metagenome TaxID=1070528 RepID=A0A6C0CIB9_9ZZZZ
MWLPTLLGLYVVAVIVVQYYPGKEIKSSILNPTEYAIWEFNMIDNENPNREEVVKQVFRILGDLSVLVPMLTLEDTFPNITEWQKVSHYHRVPFHAFESSDRLRELVARNLAAII